VYRCSQLSSVLMCILIDSPLYIYYISEPILHGPGPVYMCGCCGKSAELDGFRPPPPAQPTKPAAATDEWTKRDVAARAAR
jgi:hypothetical protein